MYNITNKFLYEILDDYRESTDCQIKTEIFDSFIKGLWESTNKRNTYIKHLTFKIQPDLLKSDIGKIFLEYSSIGYVAYHSMTKSKLYMDLIRQKVNNLYTNLCDSEVCIKKDYMDLLNIPKRLYYRWQSGLETYNADELKQLLDNSIIQSKELKIKYGKQKMNISWKEYKKLIERFLEKIFNNYIPLEEYEDKSKIVLDIDIWTEDNFIISYICKSLSGYMKNYQKVFYGINRDRNLKLLRCKECGALINNTSSTYPKQFCDKCTGYQEIGTKTINCIDCGKEVEVDAKDNSTERCVNCYKIYRRKKKTETMRNLREINK